MPQPSFIPCLQLLSDRQTTYLFEALELQQNFLIVCRFWVTAELHTLFRARSWVTARLHTLLAALGSQSSSMSCLPLLCLSQTSYPVWSPWITAKQHTVVPRIMKLLTCEFSTYETKKFLKICFNLGTKFELRRSGMNTSRKKFARQKQMQRILLYMHDIMSSHSSDDAGGSFIVI